MSQPQEHQVSMSIYCYILFLRNKYVENTEMSTSVFHWRLGCDYQISMLCIFSFFFCIYLVGVLEKGISLSVI